MNMVNIEDISDLKIALKRRVRNGAAIFMYICIIRLFAERGYNQVGALKNKNTRSTQIHVGTEMIIGGQR